MSVSFPGKKRNEGVRFNVISFTRGWVGVQLSREKRYVTLEWPLAMYLCITCVRQAHKTVTNIAGYVPVRVLMIR